MPGKKRTRPCDSCRQRKTRCQTDESETVCVLCKFHGQSCTYNQTPRPRKRSVLYAATSSHSHTGSVPHATKTIPGTGVEEYDALPDGTTLLKRTLGLQNRHHSEYLGINNTLNLCSLDIRSHTSGPTLEDSVKVRYVHPRHAFRIIPDALEPSDANEASVLIAIEDTVCGHGPELVDLYFRIIHPVFPILHKDVFLEKYARSYQEFSPPLLAAVYLLASRYWSYSDSLSTKPKPPIAPLKQLAIESLEMTMRRAKLSTVQACLLLSQVETDQTDHVSGESSLNLTAQLVQLANRLGLHLDAGAWDIPGWEISLRRRLSWAVFKQDKWLALVHGRSPLISSTAWDVQRLSSEDFPETNEDDTAGSSEVERGKLVFKHMADLTVILADVLDDLFSPRAQRSLRVGERGLLAILERIEPLQIRLKTWFSSLPETVKTDTITSIKLSSVGYLRLAYLAIESSMHHYITTTLLQDPTQDPGLVQICRNAAKERFSTACHFLNGLQASHLASFWYLTSPECAAMIYHLGSLLERTAVETEEKANLRHMLKACRWTFKVNREAGASFTKQALSLVDAAERISILSTDDMRATLTPSTTGGDVLYDLSGTTIDDFDMTTQNEQAPFPSDESFLDDLYYLGPEFR